MHFSFQLLPLHLETINQKLTVPRNWDQGLLLLTLWKLPLPLKLNSHCIISKKMGIVALRSSTSGVRVTSRMGPTMDGMNLILWGPEMEVNEDIRRLYHCKSHLNNLPPWGPEEKKKFMWTHHANQEMMTECCSLIVCGHDGDRRFTVNIPGEIVWNPQVGVM